MFFLYWYPSSLNDDLFSLLTVTCIVLHCYWYYIWLSDWFTWHTLFMLSISSLVHFIHCCVCTYVIHSLNDHCLFSWYDSTLYVCMVYLCYYFDRYFLLFPPLTFSTNVWTTEGNELLSLVQSEAEVLLLWCEIPKTLALFIIWWLLWLFVLYLHCSASPSICNRPLCISWSASPATVFEDG